MGLSEMVSFDKFCLRVYCGTISHVPPQAVEVKQSSIINIQPKIYNKMVYHYDLMILSKVPKKSFMQRKLICYHRKLLIRQIY